VRAEVISAVTAELAANGYDALSIDSVAQRSGVHRTTIYRRWRDVGGLLADALRAAQEDDWEPPNTGRLEADLVALAREIDAALTDRPSIASALIAASFRSEQAADALRSFWADRYQRCEIIVTRAIQRGEVPSNTVAGQLLIAATAPVYHERILLGTAPGLTALDHYARAAAVAASAGAYRLSSRRHDPSLSVDLRPGRSQRR
jgi:AcrR family transcriptional regulator